MIKLVVPFYQISEDHEWSEIPGLSFIVRPLSYPALPLWHNVSLLPCLLAAISDIQDSASSIDIPRYFILSQSRCVDIYKQGRMCFSSIVLHWHCYCMRNIEKYSRWLTMPKVASIGLKPDFSWIEYFPWACDLGSGPPLALPTCLTGCVHLYTGQAR